MRFIKILLIYLYTVYVWGYVVWAMTCHVIMAPIYSRFYKDREYGNIQLARWFLRFGLKLCHIKQIVSGHENVPKEGPVIIISNHQSHLDIVILMANITKKFAFIAKKELLRIPLLGQDLKNQGHIMIDRKNARSARQQLDVVKQGITNGKSVLFFPEGTRSLDGHIHDFKRGAFQIALETQTPILPCGINGTINILHKKSLLMHPAKVYFSIGKPILPPKNVAKKDERAAILQLMTDTREAILALKN